MCGLFVQFIEERLDMLNTGLGVSDEFELETLRYSEKLSRKGKHYKEFLKNVKDKVRYFRCILKFIYFTNFFSTFLLQFFFLPNNFYNLTRFCFQFVCFITHDLCYIFSLFSLNTLMQIDRFNDAHLRTYNRWFLFFVHFLVATLLKRSVESALFCLFCI